MLVNGGRPGRPEGPLDPAAGAVANLAAQLRQLRDDAGRPSYRQLARTAYYSHSTLSQAAAGRQLPSLTVTLAFVQACGGDQQEWAARWHEAAAEAGIPAEPDGDDAAGSATAAGPIIAARRGSRARLAPVRRGRWYLLAAAGLVGALAWWGLAAVVTTRPATHAASALVPIADGDYPSVADCSSWKKSLIIRPVLAADGQKIGVLRLPYSMHCAAVWARFDPDPSLSADGAVQIILTITRHPDGTTMTSKARYFPGHLQRSDILLLHGGCAQARVAVTRPGRAPVSAVTGCQPPP